MKQMQQETTNFVIMLLPGKSLTDPCNTIPTPGLGSTASICVTPAEEGELEILPSCCLIGNELEHWNKLA